MGVVMRIWRTGLDESQAAAYDRFAAERSLPMFRRRPRILGVFFTEEPGTRAVVTLWRDRRAIDALEESADYRSTVAAIEAAGFLRAPQTVEILDAGTVWLSEDLSHPGSGRAPVVL